MPFVACLFPTESHRDDSTATNHSDLKKEIIVATREIDVVRNGPGEGLRIPLHLAVDAPPAESPHSVGPQPDTTEVYSPPAPAHRSAQVAAASGVGTELPAYLLERFQRIDQQQRDTAFERRRRRSTGQEVLMLPEDSGPMLVGIPSLDAETECDGKGDGTCRKRRKKRPGKKKPGNKRKRSDTGDLPYAFFKVAMLVLLGWLGLTLFTVLGAVSGILGAAFLLIAGLGKGLAHVLGALTDGIYPPKAKKKMPVRWILSIVPWALYRLSLGIVWVGDHASHLGLCGGNYAMQGAKWFFTFRRQSCDGED